MQIQSDLAKDPAAVIAAILEVTEKKIIPLTRRNVAEGNGPFSAAILKKSNLDPVVVSCNRYRESPLLHGETNCIREFFMMPEANRPPTTETIFFATHEPCSLCLSGICWTNFQTLYFLFTYEDTRDLLAIGGDIEILEEVFRVPAPCDSKETLAARPLYNRSNKFFTAKSLAELLKEVTKPQLREQLRGEIQRVKDLFNEFRNAV